jgi:hypothetical protein
MQTQVLYYKTQEKGFVYFEGRTPLHKFYRNMAPNIASLERSLQKEFPGQVLELRPAA